MSVDYKKFGKLIYEIRKKRGLTQAQVCSQLDMCDSHYSNIENGNAHPSVDKVLKIANFYDIPISSYLLDKYTPYIVPYNVKQKFENVPYNELVKILDQLTIILKTIKED